MRLTKNLKLKTKNLNRGFTLFEMIVSLGIFSTAMLILFSALLSITSAQKKAVALSSTEDNLRFAIDSISKEIRTATSYNCGGDVPGTNDCSGGTQLALKNAAGRTVIYRLNGTSIQKGATLATMADLTGSDIQITNFRFYVTGSRAGDGLQPQVTMILRAEMGSGKEKSVFNMQTTVTQRQIDS